MTKNTIYLSIIVPVFNEENRLFHLKDICKYFNQLLPKSSEIIVVNDGSTDNTLLLLQNYQKKAKFNILSYPNNQGKGYAVRYGMLNCHGRYRLFMDLDLSVNPQTFDKCRKLLSEKSVLIAVRRLAQSRILVHQPWLRENMGRIFTWLSQKVLNVAVSDFTCGFKIFPKSAAEQIFSRARINRWGFDSEILYLAKKLKYSIYQYPVAWSNDSHTRVNLPKDSMSSLIELLSIRVYSFLGKYN